MASRKAKRMELLRSEGFLQFEMPLAKLPVKTAALQALRASRSVKFEIFKKRAARQGRSRTKTIAQYRKHIANVYRHHGWLTKGKKGQKRQPSVWAMYRASEKANPPETKEDREYRKLAAQRSHHKKGEHVSLKHVVPFKSKKRI